MAETSARSSRGSACSGLGGVGYEGQGSPIPYRTGPLAYAGEVQCDYKVKTKDCRWISWSDDNPGRRYYRCPWSKVKTKDCRFFKWLDGECSDWYKVVMRDLRDTVWKLKKESNMAVADEVVADSTMEHGDEVQKMNILLQKELLKKTAELDGKEELKDMEAKMKKKNCWLKMALCLCVVLGLVILFLTSNVPWLGM